MHCLCRLHNHLQSFAMSWKLQLLLFMHNLSRMLWKLTVLCLWRISSLWQMASRVPYESLTSCDVGQQLGLALSLKMDMGAE